MSFSIATTLEAKSLSIATSHVLVECDGSWLDAFNALVDAGDGEVPNDIVVLVDYEYYAASDLVKKIKDIQNLILDSSKELFELAKSSIVHQTIECTIDGDMNNLDFETLVEHGLALEIGA